MPRPRSIAIRQPIDSRPIMLGATSLLAAGLYLSLLPHFGLPPHSVSPALAIFVAALVSSIAGFAFSAICGALLFHLLDAPVQIVHILLVCSIVNQTLAVWSLRRNVEWPAVTPYLVTGMLGAPVGVWLLLHSQPHVYLRVFGAGLVAYSAYSLLRPATTLTRGHRVGDWLAGFVGGLGSGFAAFPGAPVSIWCTMKGWDKLRQRAVYQPFILVMQIATLLVMNILRPSGLAGLGIDAATLSYLPLSLLGTWVGLAVFRRMTDRQFGVAVNALLIVSGLSMLA